jgi:hypothetical protein
MKRYAILIVGVAMLATSCSRKMESVPVPKPSAFGAALLESSGG